jgi:hypothetical protein
MKSGAGLEAHFSKYLSAAIASWAARQLEYELRPLDATFDILRSQPWIRRMERRTSVREMRNCDGRYAIGNWHKFAVYKHSDNGRELCKWRQVALME